MSSSSQILLSLLLKMWSSSECLRMSCRSSCSHVSRFCTSLAILCFSCCTSTLVLSQFSLFFCITATVFGGGSFPLRERLRVAVFLKVFNSPISCSKLLQSFLSYRSLLLREYSCCVVPWQTRSTKRSLSSLSRDCGTERPCVKRDLPGELRTSLYIYQKNSLIIVTPSPLPSLRPSFLLQIQAFPLKRYIMFYNQEEEEAQMHCESDSITVEVPGRRVELPEGLAAQLQAMWGYKQRRLPFFGGHPASITKQTCNEIFTALNQTKQSPYLVCEKTDGVRYLLVIARVSYKDLTRDVRPGEEAPYTEFFMVSRQGTGKLVAYATQVALSHLLEPATTEVDLKGRSIVSVLDGELIKEKNKQIRYLIFDALVHLGKDICDLTLRERLECATNLLRCSEMLGPLPNPIQVKVKDFFRLTSPKFNMVEFMLKKYVKCLPHENDGLIFNHEEKKYLRGTTNPGYIKWKPAHLNTVDFMIVPNLNLEEIVGRKVLDLYLAVQDTQLEQYTRQFYAFAVVSEADFAKLHENYMENESRVAQEEMDRQQNSQNEGYVADPFAGAIIAECRYEVTKTDERSVMSKLYNLQDDELVRNIFKQGSEDKDFKAIKAMKNQIYDKGWKIYKLRPDKALPNNTDVARRIEESIRDGIAEEELIRKNNDLNKISFGL